jgi:hypothetical protein
MLKVLGSKKHQRTHRRADLRLVPQLQETGHRRAIPKALLVECNCPDFCERDHDNE